MFSLITWFSSLVFHHLGWEIFQQIPIQGFYSRFPFKVPISGFLFQVFFEVTLQQIPRSAELASEKEGNCNNVTFGAENSQSKNHVTTTNHNFTLSSLISITVLGSSSSTPQRRRYVYLQVGKVFRWMCIKRMMMNIDQNSLLIGVLGWKDFHSTLIEISLLIILYLHFTCDLNSSIL